MLKTLKDLFGAFGVRRGAEDPFTRKRDARDRRHPDGGSRTTLDMDADTDADADASAGGVGDAGGAGNDAGCAGDGGGAGGGGGD